MGGGNVAVITIRNLDDGISKSLISMARKQGLSREEFLRRQLGSIAVSGEIKETEERYRNLVIMLMCKLQDMEDIIERNSVLMEDVMEVLRDAKGE